MLPGSAATRIQASFRGHVVRRELVENVRLDFEEVMRRIEAPLRDANNPTTSPFPKGELGWKSSSSLSPPSVLDRLDDDDEDEDDDEVDENSPVVVAAPPQHAKGGAASAVAAAIDAASVAFDHERATTTDRSIDSGGRGVGGGVGGGEETPQKQTTAEYGDDDCESRASAGAECGDRSSDAVAQKLGNTGTGVESPTSPEREHHVSVLTQELAWAQSALDARRQHLRRMRMQQHQLELQRGGTGIR